jgi:hypothetical protein
MQHFFVQYPHVSIRLVKPLVDADEPLVDAVEPLVDSVESPVVFFEPVVDRRKSIAHFAAKLQNLRFEGVHSSRQ